MILPNSLTIFLKIFFVFFWLFFQKKNGNREGDYDLSVIDTGGFEEKIPVQSTVDPMTLGY